MFRYSYPKKPNILVVTSLVSAVLGILFTIFTVVITFYSDRVPSHLLFPALYLLPPIGHASLIGLVAIVLVDAFLFAFFIFMFINFMRLIFNYYLQFSSKED